MSIPGGGSPLLLGGAVGYKIERSLRFNSADSAYLSRTPASAGNRKTWTWAGWVKRSALSATQVFYSAATDSNNRCWFGFSGDFYNGTNGDKFYISQQVGGVYSDLFVSSGVFRDPSAWYHIVVALDTSQASNTNRLKIYVNGFQIDGTLATITQNADLQWNTNNGHSLGRSENTAGFYFSGYLADIHFIDGQALTPSSFAETNATTGQWVPKAYSGSYGTNGFQLKFADNSAATATTLGKDTSGNGNNWTPNNLSVTAGAGNDSLVDTPTSYGTDTSVGGEVRGNYCTLNPLAKGANVTLSDGNLQTAITGESGPHAIATVGMDYGGNDFYCEFTQTVAGSNLNMVGLVKAGVSLTTNYVGADANSWGYYGNGNKYTNGSASSYGSSWGANDVIGIAYKGSTGELFFYKNGVAQNSGNAAFSSLTNGPYFFAVGNGLGGTGVINFGQRPFAYTAPSGFKALCDTNLPAPVVAKPSTVMDVKTYTGNGSTQTISGLGFSPDLVWIKQRDTVRDNQLQDTVRGVGKELQSNAANSEGSYGLISSFNSDGFTVFTDGTYLASNQSGGSYAAWCWDAGSSTTTNNSGSISSQVRANASAGFSIVTWTGDGAASASVGHGLGVAPRLYLTKCRDSIGGVFDNWGAFTTATGSMLYGFLNTTAAFGTPGQSAPTSTTINVLSGFENVSGKRFVAYCFAPVAGYSSFGSYTGNGSTDGPFVFTGMRPRWIMLKRTDSTGNWTIIDTAREGYNVDNDPLYPNLSDAEGTADLADILSNGFKLRSTDASVNASAGTYVYACFAEAPFGLARAR